MAFFVGNEIPVVFRVKHGLQWHTVTHVFREVAEAEWTEYRRRSSRVENHGRSGPEREHTPEKAAFWLWRNNIVRVEGYEAASGGEARDLMELDNWRDLVPTGHRHTAVQRLYQDADARADDLGAGGPFGGPSGDTSTPES